MNSVNTFVLDELLDELLEELTYSIEAESKTDVSDPEWGKKKPNNVTYDNVCKPKHYNIGDIEVIDYIRDKMSNEEFEAYCIGNVIKYVSRYKHKNGKEDLQKALTYIKWAIEVSR